MQIRSIAAATAALALALASPVAATAQSSSSSSSSGIDLASAFKLSSNIAKAIAMGNEGPSASSTRSEHTVDGRRFILHVPGNYDASRAYPVIFAYGGMDHSAETAEGYMKFENTAEALVVYPQQLRVSSNAGWEGPNYGPSRGTDVAFTKEILSYLKGKYAVDSSRVYAVGLSNGGGMALADACQAPDVFAAVAGVATASYTPLFSGCYGQVPTLLMHGTSDNVAPYDRDGSNGHGGSYYSTKYAFRAIGERNACEVNNPTATERGSYTEFRFNSCIADTYLYRVNGGSHTWFAYNPSATTETWNFLRRYSK